MASRKLKLEEEYVFKNRELFKLFVLFLLLVGSLKLFVWIPDPVGQLTKYLVASTTASSGELTSLWA